MGFLTPDMLCVDLTGDRHRLAEALRRELAAEGIDLRSEFVPACPETSDRVLLCIRTAGLPEEAEARVIAAFPKGIKPPIPAKPPRRLVPRRGSGTDAWGDYVMYIPATPEAHEQVEAARAEILRDWRCRLPVKRIRRTMPAEVWYAMYLGELPGGAEALMLDRFPDALFWDPREYGGA
jgi:hypothetical protein